MGGVPREVGSPFGAKEGGRGLWERGLGGVTAERHGAATQEAGGFHTFPQIGGHLGPFWGHGGLRTKHVVRDPPLLVHSKSAAHSHSHPQLFILAKKSATKESKNPCVQQRAEEAWKKTCLRNWRHIKKLSVGLKSELLSWGYLLKGGDNNYRRGTVGGA